jgi:hypothetical protein
MVKIRKEFKTIKGPLGKWASQAEGILFFKIRR